jgi:hypothetical protein
MARTSRTSRLPLAIEHRRRSVVVTIVLASRRNNAPARMFILITLRGCIMETPHTETVVDKAVNFVKDVFGIEHEAAPEVEARPEYTDTAPEITTEGAMHLEPRAYGTRVGEVDDGSFVRPLGDPEDERIRRVVDEEHRENVRLNPESGQVEEVTSADALRPLPDAFPRKSVAEVNDEIVRGENGV